MKNIFRNEKNNKGALSSKTIQRTEPRNEASSDEKFERIIKSDFIKHKMNELRLARCYQDRDQDVKVSIIMPTWNRAFIIRRAIDSVLRQSYRNLELIISDDGSTDNTTQYIIENYADKRIKYIKSSHSGVSTARNIALKQSLGTLIGYLDSDDEWSEDYLLLMVNTFVDNPYVSTVYCGVKFLNYINKYTSVIFKAYNRETLLQRNYIPMNGFMHKRSLYNELGGFNQDLTLLVDWDLILRYTKNYPPLALECTLATYYFENGIDRLSLSKDFHDMFARVKKLHTAE